VRQNALLSIMRQNALLSIMRQNALLSTMGQMGSYIPCSFATMKLHDRIYLRSIRTQQEDLLRNMSSFSMEMKDISTLLNHYIMKRHGFATHFQDIVEPLKHYPNAAFFRLSTLLKKDATETSSSYKMDFLCKSQTGINAMRRFMTVRLSPAPARGTFSCFCRIRVGTYQDDRLFRRRP